VKDGHKKQQIVTLANIVLSGKKIKMFSSGEFLADNFNETVNY